MGFLGYLFWLGLGFGIVFFKGCFGGFKGFWEGFIVLFSRGLLLLRIACVYIVFWDLRFMWYLISLL